MKLTSSVCAISLLASAGLLSATPLDFVKRVAGSMSTLFPVSGSPLWTTFPGVAESLPLSNATLRPHNVTSRCPYTFEAAPDGTQSLKAHYPAGSYKPSENPCGGVSFYAPGPASVDLTTAKEALFSYSIYFPTGFQFVKGGKIPGFCECHVICPPSLYADESV